MPESSAEQRVFKPNLFEQEVNPLGSAVYSRVNGNGRVYKFGVEGSLLYLSQPMHRIYGRPNNVTCSYLAARLVATIIFTS